MPASTEFNLHSVLIRLLWAHRQENKLHRKTCHNHDSLYDICHFCDGLQRNCVPPMLELLEHHNRLFTGRGRI